MNQSSRAAGDVLRGMLVATFRSTLIAKSVSSVGIDHAPRMTPRFAWSSSVKESLVPSSWRLRVFRTDGP